VTQTEKVLATAKGEVGVREAGVNNVKYWSTFEPYWQGQPWCARFVRWCFWKNGLFDIAPPSESTTTNMNWAKQNKQWFREAKVGDVITFGAGASASHTGLVWKVDSLIYTYEGNTNDGTEVIPDGGGVCSKKYQKNNTRILGYIRPKYKEDEIVTQTDFDKMMENWLSRKAALGANSNMAPEEFKQAIAEGITAGNNPQLYASRQEVAVMCHRVIKK
jgi:hypothetical protein